MNPFAAASAKLSPRGVPLVVIPFMQKGPTLFNWPARATVNPVQLNSWSNPKYRFNAGSVATPEGFCYLDVDDLDMLKEISIPETFTVASRKGRHYYFAQTEATRRLGNRSLAGRFDFQQSRKQVVSPFSVHPTGYVYSIVSDAPIIPCPDELVAWIEMKTQKGFTPSGTPDSGCPGDGGLWVGGSTITKDDFEAWLDLHNVDYEKGVRRGSERRWFWIIGRCPWETLHTNKNGDRDFAVGLHDVTGPQIKCCHTSCGKHWRDYRQFLVSESGRDYSMKTGEPIEPKDAPLAGLDVVLVA